MRRLLIAASPGELRAALAEGRELVDFELARTVGRSRVGDIMLGRVARLLPALRAALIDIGQQRPAFLSADDAAPRHGLASLAEGAEVLVQVKRDARADKAAAVTLRMRLSHPLLEWTPQRSGVIAEEVGRDIRDRLIALVAGLLQPGEGVRLLAAAAAAPPAALGAAIAALRARWAAIEESRVRAAPPSCLYSLPPLDRILQALLDDAVEEILLDDPTAVSGVRTWLSRERPALVERVALHRGKEPLFEAAGLADAVAGLFEPRVALPGGGAITIEPTSAATLIDVDSGSLESERGIGEDALLTVNLSAAAAIARHIRLRGLAGALVVDFIALRRREYRERLLEAFRSSLEAEVPDAQLLGWTRLGNVELTRPRHRAPVHEAVFERTPQGGYVRTPLTTGLEALAAVARHAAAAPAHAPAIRVHPAVAEMLAGEAAPALRDLEARLGRKLAVVAEPARARDAFDIGEE